jgi:hypothetical protein
MALSPNTKRCPHCNGNLVYDRQVYPKLERLYCLQCGRDDALVKIVEDKDG